MNRDREELIIMEELRKLRERVDALEAKLSEKEPSCDSTPLKSDLPQPKASFQELLSSYQMRRSQSCTAGISTTSPIEAQPSRTIISPLTCPISSSFHTYGSGSVVSPSPGNVGSISSDYSLFGPQLGPTKIRWPKEELLKMKVKDSVAASKEDMLGMKEPMADVEEEGRRRGGNGGDGRISQGRTGTNSNISTRIRSVAACDNHEWKVVGKGNKKAQSPKSGDSSGTRTHNSSNNFSTVGERSSNSNNINISGESPHLRSESDTLASGAGASTEGAGACKYIKESGVAGFIIEIPSSLH